jgi:hypothetical protein
LVRDRVQLIAEHIRGIHWRSDTDTSIQLGALSVLRDRAHTYNEKFAVTLKRLDGSITTITNQ